MHKSMFAPATAALLAAALLAAPASAQIERQYDLIYDASNGSLTINTYGFQLITYSIQTNEVPAVDDGFLQENHTPIPGNPGFGGDPLVVFTSLDGELSDTNRDAWPLAGPVSIGNVLPTGLTPGQFADQITAAWYVNAYGTTGQPSAFFNFNLVHIPEPTTFTLLVAGTALLARRRRR